MNEKTTVLKNEVFAGPNSILLHRTTEKYEWTSLKDESRVDVDTAIRLGYLGAEGYVRFDNVEDFNAFKVWINSINLVEVV